MSYRALADNQVRKAFSLLKDLAVDAVLTKKEATAFDFSTGEAAGVKSSPVSTKIIEIKAAKLSTKTNVIEKEIMLKSQDVGDLKLYDSVTISGVVWKIGAPLKNDGYILITTVFKEA